MTLFYYYPIKRFYFSLFLLFISCIFVGIIHSNIIITHYFIIIQSTNKGPPLNMQLSSLYFLRFLAVFFFYSKRQYTDMFSKIHLCVVFEIKLNYFNCSRVLFSCFHDILDGFVLNIFF